MLRREIPVVALLAVLPVLALSPAWASGRLLGPGEGTFLHFPVRAAVWEAYARRALPAWDPSQFCGTPLLASYHPGALYPPMIALAAVPRFAAFQLLVLGSLAAAGVLMFLYVRRLHGGRVGAYLAGVSFALGPYLVGHLHDTTTVVAAPLMPLLLLAAESHLARPRTSSIVRLSLAVTLLLLAGSVPAAGAGLLLLAGRLIVARSFPGSGPQVRLGSTMMAVGLGFGLAAPQLLPSLVAAVPAGPAAAELPRATVLPSVLDFILRYISHTPAAALALAALPLLASHLSVRVLSATLLLCLVLQGGGRTAGVGPLAFEFTLSVLAGISLGAQWAARRSRRGARLRAYFLFFSLASAAALSVSAAVLGPLTSLLTGPVGVLALSLILYFSLAASPRPLVAGVWLVPLTVSFALQPQGREAWRGAATKREAERGSPTREALDRLIGQKRSDRVMTLATTFPDDHAIDLAFGPLAGLAGRRTANGYDMLARPWTLEALGGMSGAGLLPATFFSGDPARLEALGVRWIQAPTTELDRPFTTRPGSLDVRIEGGGRRLFALPIVPATEVRLAFTRSRDFASATPPELAVRTASGRGELAFSVEGHGPSVFRLPGRYWVDAVALDRPAGRGALTIAQIQLVDALTGRSRLVSPVSAFLSDRSQFREAASTPAVRLFEHPRSRGRVWVVSRLERGARDEWSAPPTPLGSPTNADILNDRSGGIDVRAAGPGFLVLADSWDRGWSAAVGGAAVDIVRVNRMAMAIALPAGTHLVSFRYWPPGFGWGLALAGLAACGLVVWARAC